MSLHDSVFNVLIPTDDQRHTIERMRRAFMDFHHVLDGLLLDGPDKTYIMRQLRDCQMWSTQCIIRNFDGSPRYGVSVEPPDA